MLSIPMAQVLRKPTLFDNCREYSTNRPYFLQNKANFKKAQMNVNSLMIKDYENERLRRPHGKQSQSKPISDDRRQITEDRKQMTDGRRQKTENR